MTRMDTDSSTRRRGDAELWTGARGRGGSRHRSDENNSRQRHRAFTGVQFRWVDGVAGDQALPFELVKLPARERAIEWDSLFVLQSGEPFSPKCDLFGIPDPNLARFRIELVAQAKSEDLVATIEQEMGVIFPLRVGAVCLHEVTERVGATDYVVRHPGRVP